jgi:S-adenosylmethionine hydrolase
VVTNLDRRSCERLAAGQGTVQLSVGGHTIDRIVSTYADLSPGEIGALFGSTDHLECSTPSADASVRLGVKVGDRVELRRL